MSPRLYQNYKQYSRLYYKIQDDTSSWPDNIFNNTVRVLKAEKSRVYK